MTLIDSIALQQLLERNIETALTDYGKHARKVEYTHTFVTRLAKDAVTAKEELRELLRKSPAWNEDLQALVINGNRTHDPDPETVKRLLRDLLVECPVSMPYDDIWGIVEWFAYDYPDGLVALKRYAPKAYAEGRKKSKVLRKFCEAMGMVDETKGSYFQRQFALIADELSSRRIDFKLYVSINPAHFLTMSNPKGDDRGSTMVSCHSLNDDSYEYNCGCSGYARDRVSMIAFTASDPSDPETLNNRKTSRQIYAYKVGSGVLLQSRLYKTQADSYRDYGGVNGEQPETKVYRDLIERELSECEGVPNLWRILPSDQTYKWVERGEGFGGYPDWTYEEMAPHICLRADHTDELLYVGADGLCFKCGTEISETLYCCDCGGWSSCEWCDRRFSDEELYDVYNFRGETMRVCEDCRNDNFYYCDECEEWYADCTRIDDWTWVCDSCLENNFVQCDECGEYVRTENTEETAEGNTVCEDCRDRYYTQCDECGEWYRSDEVSIITDPETGEVLKHICADCIANASEESEVA